MTGLRDLRYDREVRDTFTIVAEERRIEEANRKESIVESEAKEIANATIAKVTKNTITKQNFNHSD